MLDLTRLPEAELSAFVARQPWFRAHGREGAAARVVEATFVHTVAPLLAIALVEVATERGLNEIYQLPVGLRPEAESRHVAGAIASIDGWTAYDALSDPELADELVDLVRTAASAHSDDSAIEFEPRTGPDAGASARHPPSCGAIGEGHSNTSVVVGEELVLKVYRRLAPGDNPEVELLRFLTAHGFANTPELLGSYEHSGRLIDATLGIVTRFVPAECDGWAFALSSLAGDPSRFLEQLGAPRRGDRLDARRCWRPTRAIRRSPPRSRAPSRSRWSRPRSTRRSRRSSRTCPRARCWSRSPASGRRCASACGCSRA